MNMKKILSMLALLFAVCSVQAAVQVVDGVKWYYQYSSQIPTSATYPYGYVSGAEIIAGEELYTGNLKIPSNLGGHSVKAIGDYVFQNCKGLASVEVPSGVVRVGDSAFYGSALASIKLPAGVKCMGWGVFYGCDSLVEVDLPDSIVSMGSDCFEDCDNLKRVHWPTSMTTIPYSTFGDCCQLESVDIPASVTSFDRYAFRGCYRLRSLYIPAGLTTIGTDALSMVGGAMEEITIGAGNANFRVVNGCLLSMSGAVLYVASGGAKDVVVPQSVTSLPEYWLYRANCERVVLSDGIKDIPTGSFYYCPNLKSVQLPSGLLSMGGAFWECPSLEEIEFPESFQCFVRDGNSYSTSGYYGYHFVYCNALKTIRFNGPVPGEYASCCTVVKQPEKVIFNREYGAEWQKVIALDGFKGFGQPNKPEVTIVSAEVRANDATILDVVYKVTSAKSRVKVRALAFEDGERSFAKVVKVTDLIEGTAANVGDQVTANVEHKLSWRVSTDWKVDLAKVKFEVLATEDQLLPLELSTIPATASHRKMQISWNAISESQVFDALLWLYADGDEGLMLTDGMLRRKSDGYLLGYGTTVSTWTGRQYKNITGNGSTYYYFALASEYVFSKMGFSLLSGTELEYAKKRTRLALSPSGVRQYAYRLMD